MSSLSIKYSKYTMYPCLNHLNETLNLRPVKCKVRSKQKVRNLPTVPTMSRGY